MIRVSRALAGLACAGALAVPSTAAAQSPPVPVLKWSDCGGGYQCTTARVPMNYVTGKGTVRLALIRLPATDQAHRVGSLFVNFGGPGGTAVDTIHAIGKDLFGSLNDRFDIVGFDPRGVGLSTPSIDCNVNQETDGLYAQPFTTPENLDLHKLIDRGTAYVNRCVSLNGSILRFVSTANVARDMDLLRQAVGDDKLNYLGFSYGTYLGATYATLFPHNYRALVLDGALDADEYANAPLAALRDQSAGFERALGRFFMGCAADQDGCQSFGGRDPWAAFDLLVSQAYANPLPAGGDDPRPVDGDDILAGATLAMYNKQLWWALEDALGAARQGDGTGFRALADAFYGYDPSTNTYDPASDRYFTIGALDQRWPKRLSPYLAAGREAYGQFDHTFWNAGFEELDYSLYPVNGSAQVGVFRGPFRLPSDAPKVLVVATTYDPATPYRGSKELVSELGQARLLTMLGDGHTAYGGNSPCIDSDVDSYLKTLTLPDAGTVCVQDVPFDPPSATATANAKAALTGGPKIRPHQKNVVR